MAPYLAELIGTFFLIFIGVGSAVFAGAQIGALGIALAFGLTLLVMVYAIGPISGCNINPAVTLGLLICDKLSLRTAVGYWIAQVVGGIVAALVLLAIAQGMPGGYDAAVGGLASNGYGIHSPGGFSAVAGFFMELFATSLLVLTVLGATDIKAPVGFAGLAIGLALTAAVLVSIQVTNGSINPARSIGPAVVAGGWALAQLWLFIIAPLAGGALSAVIYLAMRRSAETISAPRAEEALPQEQQERKHPAT